MAYKKGGYVFCRRSSKRSAEFSDQHDNLFDRINYINNSIDWHPYFIGLGIFNVIITIIAGIKANDGESYRYPINLRLIK